MVSYNLHYFPTTGRAELIRLLFTAAGQKFTDTRVTFPEWGKLKAAGSTPWGSLPYLEVDGKELGQTKAIVRFVAHEHGLAGSGAFEQGLVDSVVEGTRDILDTLFTFQYGDAAQKDANLNKLKTTTLPAALGNLEKFITKHGQNGFTVGGKLTTADLAVFDAVDQVQAVKDAGLPNVAAGYPKVAEVLATVQANPKIATYLAARK